MDFIYRSQSEEGAKVRGLWGLLTIDYVHVVMQLNKNHTDWCGRSVCAKGEVTFLSLRPLRLPSLQADNSQRQAII